MTMRLSEKIEFSATDFDKINKGFSNVKKVNCYMNACLQSIYACPAFYNLLSAISQADLGLDKDSTVSKLCHIQKHFDAKYQLDKPFSNKVINGEYIFEEFLQNYNPQNEQQDAQDFLSLLLDMCHEELKCFHVEQVKGEEAEWAEVGVKEKSQQENQEQILQQSVIRDIFSGVVKTDLTVEGSTKPSVTYEPFYILNLEIPRDTGDL